MRLVELFDVWMRCLFMMMEGLRGGPISKLATGSGSMPLREMLIEP